MAKCWFCKTKKGKRYCTSIENVLCPICCGENRLKRIDCPEECRYLEGVVYQKERNEEKEFSKLMESIPHGPYDDIFKDPAVALMAFEIESLIRNIYISGNLRITDRTIFESYKKIYKFHVNKIQKEELELDELTKELLNLYERNIKIWELNMPNDRIGQVFLRLMLSIKKMSGGRMGEYGYLNYLKNNLGNDSLEGTVIVEDKFGNKMTQQL